MNRGVRQTFRGGRVLGVMACMILAAACSRSGAKSDGEVVGSSRQAVVNGTDDNLGLEANTVVALGNPEGGRSGIACSGTLITPLVVLTAAACVDPMRAGPRPTVRVGADLTTAKAFASQKNAEVMTGPGASNIALVYLDPNYPVLEEAKSGRQTFLGPSALPWDPSSPETAYDYLNMGIAGWSPLDEHGQPRETTANVRQQFTRPVMRVHTADGETTWVRDASADDGALMAGDLGGPIFVTDAAGVRQVLGVATQIGVMPSAAPGCPPTSQHCDVWDDVTTDVVKAWINSKVQIKPTDRTPRWFAVHSSNRVRTIDGQTIPDWWTGEVDYTGDCIPALDADCDHWYDYELDAQGQPTALVRDNCLGWWNPDQADSDNDGVGDVCDHCATIPDDQTTTSRAWVSRAPGAELGPTKRYPISAETMEAKFPGDACRTVPRVELVALGTRFEADPQNPRTKSSGNTVLRPQANNFFTLSASVNRGGTHLGYTRAMSCDCAAGTASACVSRDAAPGICPADQLFGQLPERWHRMHVADAMQPAPSRGEISDADGLVPTALGDVDAGGPETQTWSWRYWIDTPSVKPLSFSPAKDVPVTVFEGVNAAWVKNLAPLPEPRPAPSTVSDPANASERLGFTYTTVKEILNKPEPTWDLPPIDIPQYWPPRWPIDPICPNCYLGGVIIRTGPDPVTNVILRGPNGAFGSVPYALTPTVAPWRQLVLADQDEDPSFSTARGAVFDLRTGVVASSISRAMSHSNPIVTSAPNVPPPAPADPDLAVAQFLGPALALPAGAPEPHVFTMSTRYNVLFDFGTSWSGGPATELRRTNLSTFAASTSEIVGLGSVVGAAWRAVDQVPYVLDLIKESDGPAVRLSQLGMAGTKWEPFWTIASWKMTTPALYAMTSNFGSLVLSVVREQEFYIVVLDDNPQWAEPDQVVKAIYRGQGVLAVPAAMRANDKLFFGVMGAGSVQPFLYNLSGGTSGGGLVSVDPGQIQQVF